MKQAELRRPGKTIVSAEQVRAYLAKHPEFFIEHEDLLEILYLPHPSGAAVSLIERQLAIYREKNKKIQHQLDNLVQIARDNERLFQKMHKVTIALMEAADVESAVAGLEWVLHDHFRADVVSVRLVQDNNTSALTELFVPARDARLASFRKIFDSRRPKCGRPRPDQAAFLFGDNAGQVRSCAIIPFAAADTPGLLGIGSYQGERFLPSMGHMFLTRVGEMLGYRLGYLLGLPN
jgi:uncharacterized protein